MTFDGFPGSACRDTHFLVIVARRPAGGESVVKPKTVIRRDAICDIREGCGSFVGSDHEVGVVVVSAYDSVGRYDIAVNDVVSDVKQCADENLVTMDAVLQDCVAIARGRAFREEAAFGARRDDNRVLDNLCLHQSEYFCSKILPPVRPTQATTRDVPATQVNAFYLGRVDEDLKLRSR